MLPVVNVFIEPYILWIQRRLSQQEAIEYYKNNRYFIDSVNDRPGEVISSHLDAAKYIAVKGAENGLGNFINEQLDKSANYQYWRQCMPSSTSIALASFQQQYPDYDQSSVNAEINDIGYALTDEQFLFHGGLWPDPSKTQIRLEKPFSTSFCPQIALRNSEWNGKAYDAGQVDLFVLRVKSSKTNVFVYERTDAEMGHENEVLFASGAVLTLKHRELIRNNYPVGKYDYPSKEVPIYVVEVDIS